MDDYEVLCAALALRVPAFAATNLRVLEEVGSTFFQDQKLRDIVEYGLKVFRSSGTLLPAPALKADTHLFRTAAGFHPKSYAEVVDLIWALPRQTLEAALDHAQDRLVGQAQLRMAWRLQRERIDSASLSRWLAAGREIGALTRAESNGFERVSEGLLETLRAPRHGVSSGIPALDQSLDGQVVGHGETLIWLGQTNIGKSMVAHEAAIKCVQRGQAAAVVTLDSNRQNTKLRLIAKLLGWTKAQMRASPELLVQQWRGRSWDHLLYVKDPVGHFPMSSLDASLDGIEQQIGQKVELVVMDYSELRAPGLDWQVIKKTYQEFKHLCGQRELAGIDVAQENREGEASYFGIFKDCDIGVRLVVDPQMFEGRSRKTGQRYVAERQPGQDILYGKVGRNREGVMGAIFCVNLDKTTGRVTPHEVKVEDEHGSVSSA